MGAGGGGGGGKEEGVSDVRDVIRHQFRCGCSAV